jgi:hypothetical protein
MKTSPLRVTTPGDAALYGPEVLARLSDSELAKLIGDNINDETAPELWDSLLSFPALARTIRALREMVRSTQGAITRRALRAGTRWAEITRAGGPEAAAEIGAMDAELAEWQLRAERFLNLASARLDQAMAESERLAPSGAWLGPAGAYFGELRAALAAVITAVEKHRAEIEEGGPEDAADGELWDLVVNLCITTPGGTFPAAEWAGSVAAVASAARQFPQFPVAS